MTARQRKPRFKALLFDLDGTLIEFKFKVKESRLAIIEWLESNSYDVSGISPEMKTQAIFDVVKNQSPARGDNLSYNQAWRSMCDILDGFEMKSIQESLPHPGSLELLRRLKHEQVLTALVTNSGRRPIDSILGAYGMLPYLNLVISRDEMERLKPEPDGLLKALESLAVDKGDSAYVGDSVIDIQAARKAGVASIALSQGMSTGHLLAREEPDYMISSIEQVEDVLFS